jgi:Zn-finger nucleic acid-binding protein
MRLALANLFRVLYPSVMSLPALQHYCPNCKISLIENKNRYGSVWFCATCMGEGLPVDLLQKTSDPKAIKEIWDNAKLENHRSGKSCEACQKPMLVSKTSDKLGAIELDACPTCYLLWFDMDELQKLFNKLHSPQTEEGLLVEKKQGEYHEEGYSPFEKALLNVMRPSFYRNNRTGLIYTPDYDYK